MGSVVVIDTMIVKFVRDERRPMSDDKNLPFEPFGVGGNSLQGAMSEIRGRKTSAYSDTIEVPTQTTLGSPDGQSLDEPNRAQSEFGQSEKKKKIDIEKKKKPED